MAYIEMKKRELVEAWEEAHKLEDIYDDLNAAKRSATSKEAYLDKLKLDISSLQEEVDYIHNVVYKHIDLILFESTSDALGEALDALHKASRTLAVAKASLNEKWQESKAKMLKSTTNAIQLREEVDSLERRL